MPNMPTLIELLQAGVHFGHQANRWHPKMEPYIFGARNNVHVVHLEKTQQMLLEAANFLKTIVAKGGVVLFIGTKRQARAPVTAAAQSCGMPYMTERWLGGMLTNFSEIHRLIDRFRSMKKERDTGGLEKYTKKERALFDKEIAKLESVLAGVEMLDVKPQAVFIVDIRHEKTAKREATAMGIPLVALCDTNVNPDGVEYVIPGNDDAVRSITMIAQTVAAAVNEGRVEAKKAQPIGTGSSAVPQAARATEIAVQEAV